MALSLPRQLLGLRKGAVPLYSSLLSTPTRIAIATFSISTRRSSPQPPPGAQPPPRPLSADEALLRNAISRLTPSQIHFLLTNPASSWSPSPPPPPPPQRRRYLLRLAAVGIVSFLATYGLARWQIAHHEDYSHLFDPPAPAPGSPLHAAYVRDLADRALHDVVLVSPLARQLCTSDHWLVYSRYGFAEAALASLADHYPDEELEGMHGAVDTEARPGPLAHQYLDGAARQALPAYLIATNLLTNETLAVVSPGHHAASVDFPGYAQTGLLAAVVVDLVDVWTITRRGVWPRLLRLNLSSVEPVQTSTPFIVRLDLVKADQEGREGLGLKPPDEAMWDGSIDENEVMLTAEFYARVESVGGDLPPVILTEVRCLMGWPVAKDKYKGHEDEFLPYLPLVEEPAVDGV